MGEDRDKWKGDAREMEISGRVMMTNGKVMCG